MTRMDKNSFLFPQKKPRQPDFSSSRSVWNQPLYCPGVPSVNQVYLPETLFMTTQQVSMFWQIVAGMAQSNVAEDFFPKVIADIWNITHFSNGMQHNFTGFGGRLTSVCRSKKVLNKKASNIKFQG